MHIGCEKSIKPSAEWEKAIKISEISPAACHSPTPRIKVNLAENSGRRRTKTIKNWINLQPTAIHFAIIARVGNVVKIKPKSIYCVLGWKMALLGLRIPGFCIWTSIMNKLLSHKVVPFLIVDLTSPLNGFDENCRKFAVFFLMSCCKFPRWV